MIVGIGTDIVSVARLRGMWERHGDSVQNRLLSPVEFTDFAQAADKGRFLAKRFAAKEALAKAMGTGVRAPVLLTAMGVTHDELGKPQWVFNGELAELVAQRGITAHLSISDEAEYAVAFVILEQP